MGDGCFKIVDIVRDISRQHECVSIAVPYYKMEMVCERYNTKPC